MKKTYGTMELVFNIPKELKNKIDPLAILETKLMIKLHDGSLHTIEVNEIIDVTFDEEFEAQFEDEYEKEDII